MPIIETHDLTRRFDALTAVNRLNLEVAQGEIFGLVGPDGAGKTTTLRMLCGLMNPSEGSARVAGHDVEHESQAVKDQIGYMAQRFGLYGDLTVEENMVFYADLFGIVGVERERLTAELLRMTRMEPFRNRQAARLSGGMKQKLALMCTLIHRPEILFLDEPTTGVDPVSRREFWEILQQIHAEGVTIVVTTPYMDEAEQCSRIGLMFRGKLIATDSPRNMKRSFRQAVLEAHPRRPDEFAGVIKQAAGISDWQQLGDRFHIVAADDNSADELMKIAGPDAGIRRIAASIEDVFVEKIK